MRWVGTITLVVAFACGSRTELGEPIFEDASIIVDASVPEVVAIFPDVSAPDVIEEPIPTPPPPPTPVVRAASSFACALLVTGNVKCWGDNTYGQLGDGTYDSSATPVDVIGLTNVSGIGIGNEFACAMLAAGGMRCWGADVYHQLDDITGGGGFQTKPVVAKDFSGSVLAAAGSETSVCALLGDGTTECWGWGLGSGYEDPTKVNLDPATELVMTPTGTAYALTKTGTVEIWSNGTKTSGPQSNVIDIGDGSCVVTAGGVLDCGAPLVVDGGVIAPSGPISHVAQSNNVGLCVVLTSGGVQCSPADYYGDTSAAFVDVPGVTNAVFIAAAEQYACIVLATGHVQCWGGGLAGNAPTPVDVVGIP